MKEGTLSLGVSLCRYQFHPKPPPWDKLPGHDLKGTKNPSPRDNHYVQKPSPRDKTGSQKPPPLGHKAKKFHKCMYL